MAVADSLDRAMLPVGISGSTRAFVLVRLEAEPTSRLKVFSNGSSSASMPTDQCDPVGADPSETGPLVGCASGGAALGLGVEAIRRGAAVPRRQR